MSPKSMAPRRPLPTGRASTQRRAGSRYQRVVLPLGALTEDASLWWGDARGARVAPAAAAAVAFRKARRLGCKVIASGVEARCQERLPCPSSALDRRPYLHT